MFFEITVLGASEITVWTRVRFLSCVYPLVSQKVGFDRGFIWAVEALMDGEEASSSSSSSSGVGGSSSSGCHHHSSSFSSPNINVDTNSASRLQLFKVE
ncbi:hypothetical protein Pmani_022073 [Petrolisthes manimaculis]|uniref:Uncharacterized protein n=1 Tax=Petrolisthes manimaculis TaxID=1843537 RepID=A0AAE1U110_9EUCA|nr:hypothetical protein Pmani_022073 [Petrolisthes manimaculis]